MGNEDTKLSKKVARLLDRVSSSDAGAVAALHLRKMVKLHENSLTRDGQPSPLAACTASKERMDRSGLLVVTDVTPNEGHRADKAASYIDKHWGENSPREFKEIAAQVENCLKESVMDSVEGRDGLAPWEKSVSPQDLVHHLMEIDLETGKAKRRTMIMLPKLYIGSCSCCLTDTKAEMLGVLHNGLTAGVDLDNATDVRSRRKALFGKLPNMSEEKEAVLKRIGEHMTEASANGDPVDLMSLMMPRFDAVLQSVLVLKRDQKRFKWEQRLACLSCMDLLDGGDPKMFYALRQNLAVNNIWNSLRTGSKRDDKSDNNFAIINSLRAAGSELRKKSAALLDGANEGRKQGDSRAISGKRRTPDEIHQLCIELKQAGLVDLVWTPKQRKGKKTRLMSLKNGTTVQDAVRALENHSTMKKELAAIDDDLNDTEGQIAELMKTEEEVTTPEPEPVSIVEDFSDVKPSDLDGMTKKELFTKFRSMWNADATFEKVNGQLKKAEMIDFIKRAILTQNEEGAL